MVSGDDDPESHESGPEQDHNKISLDEQRLMPPPPRPSPPRSHGHNVAPASEETIVVCTQPHGRFSPRGLPSPRIHSPLSSQPQTHNPLPPPLPIPLQSSSAGSENPRLPPMARLHDPVQPRTETQVPLPNGRNSHVQTANERSRTAVPHQPGQHPQPRQYQLPSLRPAQPQPRQ
ncbi:hypothetical protein B0J18DRAFT_166459 [Chaetomium sp. MPI-SDFR-AT-0129]|nr:hypothetical protein B0J18DRAFT_166459 [Chaetomium sp. MPI-SDFR-AT-0129]